MELKYACQVCWLKYEPQQLKVPFPSQVWGEERLSSPVPLSGAEGPSHRSLLELQARCNLCSGEWSSASWACPAQSQLQVPRGTGIHPWAAVVSSSCSGQNVLELSLGCENPITHEQGIDDQVKPAQRSAQTCPSLPRCHCHCSRMDMWQQCINTAGYSSQTLH